MPTHIPIEEFMSASFKGREAAAQLVADRWPDRFPIELSVKAWSRCVQEILPMAAKIRNQEKVAESQNRQEW